MKTALALCSFTVGLLSSTPSLFAQDAFVDLEEPRPLYYYLQPEFSGGVGYLDEAEQPYLYAQFGGHINLDGIFSHHFFLEFLFYDEEALLEGFDAFGSFLEEGDISYYTLTANYEFEVSLGGPFSAYVGAGAGLEWIVLDDSIEEFVDSDTSFVVQTFFGLRAQLSEDLQIQAGARYLFRNDFELINDEFISNDTWGYEIGLKFRF